MPDPESGIGRRPVRRAGLGLLLLSWQAIGIIYSDIGTSPLYVLNGIWPTTEPVPPAEDVIGGISCIIWALTLLPLLKYVFVALRFGTDEGEGGCFALYHGLIPPSHENAEDDRVLTGDSTFQAKSTRSVRFQLVRFKWILLPWALFGTALTMADGIFTPAVSITSAVGGIAVNVPSVSSKVAPISIAFLIVLFLAQRFGTSHLSVVFSPVTFTWLALNAVCGAINIASYPGIFRAFDPSRAVLLFVRTRDYDILAGVLLAVTGCEALFANLGQFNALSIQISFTGLVYPALLLAYLGQGARLISDGDKVITNIFYRTIPGPQNGPLFWIIYVFAILATFVASQAMITATFSLIQQVINLKSFPPLRMVFTSETIQGQVYIPAVNWTLAIATIVVVAAFGSSTALTNAYGFAVATVMFTTTILLAVQCRFVKHLPWVVCAMFLFFFGFFDALFWGASLKKIPHGAWVPLMIGCILCFTMVFWSWAKGLEDQFDGANRKNLRRFIVTSDNPESPLLGLTEHDHGDNPEMEKEDEGQSNTTPEKPPVEKPTAQRYYLAANDDDLPGAAHARELAMLPILAVFHKFASGRGIPHSFVAFLKQYPALPRVVVFLTVHIMPTARIPVKDRYIVSKVKSLHGFYGVTYQKGYREDFQVDIDAIVTDICRLESEAHGVSDNPDSIIVREIREAAERTTHIIPHYDVVSKPGDEYNLDRMRLILPVVNWVRQLLIDDIYRRLATMFPETANWLTSSDQIIHVGITAHI